MNQITLRQLRYFDAVSRIGHFGRAADACSISQPALSMQIKELEEALGNALVERASRQVTLTRFGVEVAARARQILRMVEELGDFARASRDRLSGTLRLGMIPTVAPYILPALISDLARVYPGLDVHVRETVTPRLIEELMEGRLDTAVLALPVSMPALAEIPLLTEHFLLVRPIADGNRPAPSRQELRDMKLLLLEEGHCFREQALAFCELQPSPAREVLDASSLSTLVQMVGSGIGVTLIPEMAVAIETRSAAVSVTRFEDPQPARTIGMVWRKSSPLVRQFQEIADAIRPRINDRPPPNQVV